MNILAFAASLRAASFNRQLIRQAGAILRATPGIDVDLADFREFEMPMYDGDLEERDGIPAGGREFIRRIQAADGLVISTPEYNGGIPGTLKNAIDWASRTDPIPFEGKPILLIGASPGGLGAVRSLWHSRVPLETIGAYVYPEMLGVPRAHQAFDDSGTLRDANMLSRLRGLLESYIDFVGKLRGRT
jgi:chromate reductase, NAD(P)H dehydrogenase (quinone)